MEIGKLGVWAVLENRTAVESAALAQRIEQLGYSAIWMPEGLGRDAIAHSAMLLCKTSALNIATGICNIYGRDPATMNGGQLALNEQSGGRFLLGLGVSHKNIVTGLRGHEYGKPIETMRNYLAGMKSAGYIAPRPTDKPKTIIAALGPRMMALARDEADGAHPYNTSPTHTAQARKILGPGKWLCIEQKVILESNADRARDAARKALGAYLLAPNYTNHWKRMGFNDADFANGGSDRLIDDTIAWGDQAALIKRIEQHWEAGADHVSIQAIDTKNPVDATGLANINEGLLKTLASAIV